MNTRRKVEQFYHDLPEGDLLYESDNFTTVERLEDRLIIKVYGSKYENWKQLADFLRCETRLIHDWGWELMRKRLKDWSEIDTIKRNERFDKARLDNYHAMKGDDPYLYMYFHDDKNWVMYEGPEEYLFIYELHTHDYDLSRNDIDALEFNPNDEVEHIYWFLMQWHDRVNGYPDDEEDDDDVLYEKVEEDEGDEEVEEDE